MPTTINPTSGQPLRQYHWHDAASIENKLAAARSAYLDWRQLSFDERGQRLKAIAAELRRNKQHHADLMTEEMGKPQKEALGEVEKTASCCDHYAEHAATYLAADVLPSDASRSWVQYLPLGTVLGILPWNSPYWLAARVFAPALMAGNSVIIKHDPHVPGCAEAIEQLFQQAGAPTGLLQTLLIGNDTCAEVIRDPRIQAISFTGSTAGGKQVAAQAAAEIKPAVLELGGSDPAIVLADADIDQAVDTLATSRFICAGQSCVAAKRLLVERPIYQQFVERFKAGIASLKLGDPCLPDTDIGPLARDDIRARLHDQVSRSIASGANCLLGGELPAGPGCFYPVTLLTEVPLEAAAFSEETFGPVAAIRPVKDIDEALTIANQTPYGLAASIWTQNERGERLARELEAGQIAINGIVKTDPRLPSGGIKQSGYGKELGPHGIREFVNAQQVWMK